tara:strand:- start:2430 stop:2819 length:390 start_codon:yes stop_codon:yes gene_type:complete
LTTKCESPSFFLRETGDVNFVAEWQTLESTREEVEQARFSEASGYIIPVFDLTKVTAALAGTRALKNLLAGLHQLQELCEGGRIFLLYDHIIRPSNGVVLGPHFFVWELKDVVKGQRTARTALCIRAST